MKLLFESKRYPPSLASRECELPVASRHVAKFIVSSQFYYCSVSYSLSGQSPLVTHTRGTRARANSILLLDCKSKSKILFVQKASYKLAPYLTTSYAIAKLAV